MMGDIEDLVRRIVDQVLSRRPKPMIGTVTSYDPNRYAAKVLLQPKGVETGWLPIETGHIGNGVGIAIGLTSGDQVKLDFVGGDRDAPVITGRLHSDQERPPLAQSGEIVIQTAAGFILKADQSGALTITLNGKDLTINAGGGNVHINSAGLFHNSKSVGDTHKHGGVTAGASDTDVPI